MPPTDRSAACQHCRTGWLENRYGQDVECVNGVLIDIDVAFDGWQRDVDYPVAPCHPMWSRQAAGDEDFSNDCQERLEAWAASSVQADSEPADAALQVIPVETRAAQNPLQPRGSGETHRE